MAKTATRPVHDVEHWRRHVRPAIRARQIIAAGKLIDRLIADGYLTADDFQQLADRLTGAR